MAGDPPRVAVDRCFAAVVCDWDGTMVPNRQATAGAARRLVERLTRLGVDVIIVSGTHVGNVDGQLRARPAGPGRLHLCLNRGSEVFRVNSHGPRLLQRRRATPDEEAKLDLAAALTVERFAAAGLVTEVVSCRLNRRKIDLIPAARWADPPKSAIAELLVAVTQRLEACGFAELAAAVACAGEASAAAGLVDARVTTDVKHVEIGLTDKSDSMHWALGYLARRGVGPGLLLVAGDEFGSLGGVAGSDAALLVPGAQRAAAVSVGIEPAGVPAGVGHQPGGPVTFLARLAELCTRLERSVPDVDDDPSWVLHLPVDAERDDVDEALTTLADGRFGTRGAREEHGAATGQVLAAGIYTGSNATQHLLAAPSWVGVRGIRGPAQSDERMLDLRTGVLARSRVDANGAFRSLRVVSAAHPGVMGLRAEQNGNLYGEPLTLAPGSAGERGRLGRVTWARVRADPVGGVAAAGADRRHRQDGWVYLERRAAYVVDAQRAPSAADAIARLQSSAAIPFTALLAEQRATWGARWADADVLIPDDPELALAARFALFHLISSVPGRGEAAVGARGLSGPGYAGHVFWDADVFVLPVLAAVRPAAARAMLEYRLRRLAAARAFAASSGRRGARFPWESARDGNDVTPQLGQLGGRVVPIRTGMAEEHIVADVAWAAWQYAEWSGDDAFLTGAGLPLVVETARYWASRVRQDAGGSAHLDGVVGPDEYHGLVDDNAFTNVMARWNLRLAADLVTSHPVRVAPAEALQWRAVADALVDGYDPHTGRYEQFAGYHRRQELLPTSLGDPPLAADLLLGADRVAGTQIIKQADVLMLHHLIPDAVQPGSLRANLDYYGPRTAHGSSLSPAVHAALLARAGSPDEALDWLRLAARLDLAGLTPSSATGLHLATMGGLWQAIAFGFAGLHADGGVLRVDPHLPLAWSSLSLRLLFRGRRVTVSLRHDEVRIEGDGPVAVALADASPTTTAHVVWPLGTGGGGGPSPLPQVRG